MCGELACLQGHHYLIRDGIGRLLRPQFDSAQDLMTQAKRQEQHAHDEYSLVHDKAMVVDKDHLFSWLDYYQLFDFLPRLQALQPENVLGAMCGSGFEFDLFAQLTPHVWGADISTGLLRNAAERASHLGLTGALLSSDIERLPFVDGAFDLVVVHHGLHHLHTLTTALPELLRVSRRYCLLCEPVDGLARRLLRRTGISPDREEGGAYVRDVSEQELRQICMTYGATLELAQRLFYPRTRATHPTRLYRIADRLRLANALRGPFRLFNRVLGSWLGTKGTFLIRVAEGHREVVHISPAT